MNDRMQAEKDTGQHHAEVVIVGGGPVGMGLAIELGQRGVRTIVLALFSWLLARRIIGLGS